MNKHFKRCQKLFAASLAILMCRISGPGDKLGAMEKLNEEEKVNTKSEDNKPKKKADWLSKSLNYFGSMFSGTSKAQDDTQDKIVKKLRSGDLVGVDEKTHRNKIDDLKDLFDQLYDEKEKTSPFYNSNFCDYYKKSGYDPIKTILKAGLDRVENQSNTLKAFIEALKEGTKNYCRKYCERTQNATEKAGEEQENYEERASFVIEKHELNSEQEQINKDMGRPDEQLDENIQKYWGYRLRSMAGKRKNTGEKGYTQGIINILTILTEQHYINPIQYDTQEGTQEIEKLKNLVELWSNIVENGISDGMKKNLLSEKDKIVEKGISQEITITSLSDEDNKKVHEIVRKLDKLCDEKDNYVKDQVKKIKVMIDLGNDGYTILDMILTGLLIRWYDIPKLRSVGAEFFFKNNKNTENFYVFIFNELKKIIGVR